MVVESYKSIVANWYEKTFVHKDAVATPVQLPTSCKVIMFKLIKERR